MRKDVFTGNMFEPPEGPKPGDVGYLPEGSKIVAGDGSEYNPHTLEIEVEESSPELLEMIEIAKRQLPNVTDKKAIYNWAHGLLRQKQKRDQSEKKKH